MQNEPSNDVVEQTAGPGAIEDSGEAPRPILEGASELEYVEVLNPLSVTFVGQFGVTRPVNAPVRIVNDPRNPTSTTNEGDLRSHYGLELRNPAHTGKANIVNKVSIKSGKTVRLLGNEAQVVVKQLVDEIMQREGKRLQLADPFARRQVEARIVLSRGSMNDILGRSPLTVNEQLQEAIKEPIHEPDFPSVQTPEADRGGSSGDGVSDFGDSDRSLAESGESTEAAV